jgi:predicted methyltransferase
MKNIFILTFIFLYSSTAFAQTINNNVEKYMQGDHRSDSNISRNQYRHPKETLAFFEIEENMHVVEIWPSSGWYTEILAPALKEKGKYYAAGFAVSAKRTPEWRKNMVANFNDKLKKHPELYSEVIVTELSVPERVEIAPANSVDRVLTFRNVHNWMKGDYEDGVFAAMFNALKPGGVLGLVEHRAKEGTPIKQQKKSGYISESHVIALAEKAGFKLLAKSEVNANKLDSKDHPKGVWTLPPSLRLKDIDKEKYLAIGESDRMTLTFIKPK